MGIYFIFGYTVCKPKHINLFTRLHFHLPFACTCPYVRTYINAHTEMPCVPTPSFHHSEEPVWVSGCCRLPGHGVLCCHASGVRDPGSGVGRPAVLLLQGPHQTAGGGGVGEVG